MAAFAANQTISMDKYKWILYGDDDTVWVPENVLKMLNGLDHTMPYFLSDHIWFPEWHGMPIRARACCAAPSRSRQRFKKYKSYATCSEHFAPPQ